MRSSRTSLSAADACTCVQEAALAALQLGPRGGAPVAAMTAEFAARRDLVVARLNQVPGLRGRVPEPQGAFYVLPDMSAFFGPGVTAEGFGAVPDGDALCRYLLEVAHVAAVPGEAFGAPRCVRFSYAAAPEVLEEALRRVAAALAPDRLHAPPR
jgi:bifunctional aspartate aminotransferase and glutamate/aspartate-prephenate aminotransferase